MQTWQGILFSVENFVPILLGGAIVSIQVAAGALLVAICGGLALALLSKSRTAPLRSDRGLLCRVDRGTPALAQLFIIYFGLADIGLGMPPIIAAIVGLGVNGSADLAEVFRAGIQAINRGQQTEAAASLGMTPTVAMRFVVLPQATRVMLLPFPYPRRPAAQGYFAHFSDRGTRNRCSAPETL